jgi:hydrogenase nickel incorporation protein HypB
VNLIAPPGSGKTSLVRRTIAALGQSVRVGVLSTAGRPTGEAPGPADSTETAGSLQVTAAGFAQALSRLDLRQIDLLIVKNAAYFICPATYRLGTHANVRLTTVLEREARPHDHPQLYEGLDALLVNMVDRLEESVFNVARFRTGIDALDPHLFVLPLSCASGLGVDAWVAWLESRRRLQFFRRPAAVPGLPDGAY